MNLHCANYLQYFNVGYIIILWWCLNDLRLAGAVRVTVYEHYNKQGAILKVNDVKQCTSLPRQWQDKISSIDSHGTCLVLFENSDCTGKYIRLHPGAATYVSNLKRIGFNDIIASLKPCQVKTLLLPGRYAIQNAQDKKYLTARHLLAGYTAVDTEKWRQKISQQWDVTSNRDGTYWLLPRIHVSQNPLTYDMRKRTKDDFPEIGMFKEREYWQLKNVKDNIFMIKNDDTRKCLLMEDESLIEQDDCDKDSTNQLWNFHKLES